jgi:2-iminobutanoate/2-iminopropanoate deaminase
MEITYVKTDKAPQAIGPYSQAVKAGGLVFLSGQIGLVPATGELAPGGIEAQTIQVLENVKQVLIAAGSGFENVVEATLYLADMRDFSKVNEVYGNFLGGNRPARATVQVAALPRQALIEIKVTALERGTL